MSNFIHPSAIVDRSAEIGSGNYIGPYCVLGPGVVLGDGNRLEAYVSIGSPAEHVDYLRAEPGPVRIGNECVVREFTTITGGTIGATRLENGILILSGCRICHDVVIGDGSCLAMNTVVSGYSVLGEGCNLGAGCAVHQRRVIGAYSMIGMNSTVVRNLLPFVVSYGTPAKAVRVNHVGLYRSGIDEAELSLFERWFGKCREGLAPPALDHEYQRHLDKFEEDCRRIEALSNAA